MAPINEEKLQEKARAHAEEVFLIQKVDFHISKCNLTDEQADPILSAIHDQVVRSFAEGYKARALEDLGHVQQ